MRFEYWFDFSCPYAYLASTQVEALAARTGAELDARPMLLGGVFRAHDTPQKLFAVHSPAKARHNANDMNRYAALFGATLKMPEGHPVRTVAALRAMLAIGAPFMPIARAFFQAYWVDGVDLSKEEGVAAVLTRHGHDARAVMAKAESAAIKDELRVRTDEAIAKGVFGAPSFFVGDQMWFGQDRLPLVEKALGGTPAPLAKAPGPPRTPVDVWFDYSSPFAWFGVLRAKTVLGPAARLRPMLLGAVFKAVEQVNVPLFAQSEAKQRYTQLDCLRHAEICGVEYRFPTKFPMNTVLPLRITLLAKAHETERGRALIERIFSAFWSEDRDISSPAVMTEILDELGMDRGLIEGASAPEVKDALRKSTDEAIAAGVFGAPSYVVSLPGRPASLYWGADRVELSALAASGVEAAY